MAQQKVRIKLPTRKKLNRIDRVAIAQEVIDFIVNRSKEGLDKNNKPFPGYGKDYQGSDDFRIAGKSAKVDLTLSGDMLDSIEILDEGSGYATIGFDPGEINDRAEGNIKGTYGQPKPIPGKKRDFLGIASKDLNKIVNDYLKAKDGN